MPCNRIYSKVVSVKFRLTPVGRTKETFYKSKLFTTSYQCSKQYEQFKTYADELYRDFIRNSLGTLVLDDNEIDACMVDRRAGLFSSSNALIKKISEHLRGQEQLATLQDCKELVGVVQSVGYDTDFSCFLSDSTLVQRYIDSKRALFGTDKDASIAGRFVCDIFPTFYYNRGLQESFNGEQYGGSYSFFLNQDNIDNYNLDEIEAQLSVYCFRNGINFASEEDNSEEQEIQPTTFNLNNNEDTDDAPEWVKAVRCIQNKEEF